MESNEAFSIILPQRPNQSKILILLDDCCMLFRAEDFEEIIDSWRAIDECSDL